MKQDTVFARFDIAEEDVTAIREFGQAMGDQKRQFVLDWYLWLQQQEEFNTYFDRRPDTLERVQSLQIDHWQTFFECELDEHYIASRRKIGAIHEHIQLPNDAYCAGMNIAAKLLKQQIRGLAPNAETANRWADATTKLINLDTYLSLDEITRIQTEKIRAQSNALMEVSTPVTPIWEGILLLPLLGIIDSARTQYIMNTTLEKISTIRTQVFVMDISGVSAVDTAVANQLIKITKATELMGCKSIISGISPAIARTLVELGISIGDLQTTSTLRDAFEIAIRHIDPNNPMLPKNDSH
jgi:rsbT co-antagonist protein RsbR